MDLQRDTHWRLFEIALYHKSNGYSIHTNRHKRFHCFQILYCSHNDNFLLHSRSDYHQDNWQIPLNIRQYLHRAINRMSQRCPLWGVSEISYIGVMTRESFSQRGLTFTHVRHLFKTTVTVANVWTCSIATCRVGGALCFPSISAFINIWNQHKK